MKLKLTALLLIVIFALFWALPTMAQDATPEPSPTGETTEVAPTTVGDVVTTVNVSPPAETSFPIFNLSELLASIGLFLVYLLTQATAAQAAIAKIKPVILEPIRVRFTLDDAAYNVLVGFAQLLAGLVTMLSFGGLVTAKAALAPVLAVLPIPDPVIFIGALLLLVAGQDIINGLIQGLYAVQAGLGELDVPAQKLQVDPPPVAQSARDEQVNRGRY